MKHTISGKPVLAAQEIKITNIYFVSNWVEQRQIVMIKENRFHKLKIIPDKRKELECWQFSRKRFIGSALMAGFLVNFPLSRAIGGKVGSLGQLSQDQLLIIVSVQKILYPSDGNGPGAYDVMADKYLLWVLSDERMDPEEKEYIINGIGWVDETAEENFSRNFMQLTQAEKEKLIEDISKETWGRSWLGVILTFIFEALLSDPKYGGNTDEIGWDWLHHNPGHPRPTNDLIYPKIFKTVG